MIQKKGNLTASLFFVFLLLKEELHTFYGTRSAERDE